MKQFTWLKRNLVILAPAIFFHSCLVAQEAKIAKNFPGVFAGIEWNTISGSWGFEYERFLFTKDKIAIGAKTGYITRYEYGNLEILSGSTCCETSSHALLVATTSYFTGKKRNFSGFFLHVALGAAISRLKYTNQAYENVKTVFRPALELGPGWQIHVGESIDLRFKGSAGFGPFKGSFTSTTVALGF